MRLLVTGASGFVGGHLLEFVRTAHPSVEVFALVRPHGGAHGETPAGVAVAEVNLDDAASVADVVSSARPDAVVHLAGQSSVHESWIDPGGTLRTNVLGIVNLMDGLRAAGRPARVLVVGSADEYGVVDPASLPVREDHPRRPVSPYAVSKVAQGLLALEYASPGGLEVIRTRTFPHTGPRRGEVFAESSFARQIAEIEAGRRPPVLHVGNLEAVRDYTDVRDVVRAYWALLEDGRPGEVYNVCSGTGTRIGHILAELRRAAAVEMEVREDPARLRPQDLAVLVGDPARLREATGWTPGFPLARTLRDLLAYWRERVSSGGTTEA